MTLHVAEDCASTLWCDDPDHHNGNIHVTPTNDLASHVACEECGCACGPLVDPVQREDGSFGWVVVHHSLDGRELTE